ncbi:MAG: twin-arginine translocation signal domain-containing protein [Myxococcales bacterium]|nr:twin-arginine translocation signal domain-containing protein [Myxococcales bacterium]
MKNKTHILRKGISRRDFLKGVAGATAGLAIGCGSKGSDSLAGMKTKDGKKVLVLGFDGMDPILVQSWMKEGLLPNFVRLQQMGGFSVLGTSIPPQSPVAWSNFITGMDPGGHGIFDFIHRDPKTILPFLSTSRVEPSSKFWEIGKYKFPRDGGQMELLRHGKAFWEFLGDANIPATVFCVPSNFPPVTGPFRSLSGMGTPDLLGGYGSFSYFTDNPPPEDPEHEISGGKVYPVDVVEGVVDCKLIGPQNTYLKTSDEMSPPDAELPFRVYGDRDADAAVLEINGERQVLGVGEWTDWLAVDFILVPGVSSANGMVRFYLKSVNPHFGLYVSPINIDPRDPLMTISTPDDYSAELAEARGGAFHTQGIPEDTKALSSRILTNAEFLMQADRVLSERHDLFNYELARFHDGLLFFYFSSSDQLTHMFWRTMDHDHPAYNPEEDEPFTNVVRDTYIKLDKVLGQAIDALDEKTTLLVMSDHGFAPYYKSFHLSSWLLDNGYVKLKDPTDRKSEFLTNVNWYGTKAYTLGINSFYLNLAGRERYGIVGAGDADRLLDEIRAKLLALTDPDNGRQIISHVYKTSEVYHGEFQKTAPDLIIGYARGYRGSWETALGKFPTGSYLRANTDAWGGDHCMATEEVPGILFASQPIQLSDPNLKDLPLTIVELFGLPRPPEMVGRNVFTGK